jgi:hypothetical protein
VNFEFPNNHAPLGDSSVSQYLFFDIGNFGNTDPIVNFADGSSSNAWGEIMDLEVDFGSDPSGLNFVHFDVMAIGTKLANGNHTSTLVSNWDNNPGSHDVTWKSGETPPPPAARAK